MSQHGWKLQKKVHLKSQKNKKKLSRIAWVYYQEKKYKTNHKF